MIRIQKLSNHNDTICWKQHWRKCQITNPFSDQILWNINHTTRIQFQNSLLKTTYVITRNSNITTTRLVFIRLRFHAVSSRLLLSPWHSNDPEPMIHLFLLESKLQFCPASCPWWLPTSVPDTGDHPRRYAIVGLCVGELTETIRLILTADFPY